MKIKFFSSRQYEIENIQGANTNGYQLQFEPELLNEETAKTTKGLDAVSVFVNDTVNQEVLHLLKENGVKYIAVRAAGYNNVDLTAAKNLGISVANVPDYSPFAVAEHTVALLLALNRNLIQANHRILNHDFTLDGLTGFDLNGKTAGIIGTGKIGSLVAKILHGFGCNLLGFDIAENKNLTEDYHLTYTSLEEIYNQSDILTLHCPLTLQTNYLLDEAAFSKMKKGVMIVNTGRGGLINTADALKALDAGIIGYLGLDVYEKEKGIFFYNHAAKGVQDELLKKLMTYKNVLITPHMSFLTHTALKNIADTTMESIQCWSESKKSPNELT